MIDKEIRDILSKRKALHPEDSFAAEKCWDEEIHLMCRDIEQTIDFLENRCTGDEFAWLSEVFEDVQEQTKSVRFTECLCTLAEKFPEETQEYNILEFINCLEETDKN